MTSRSSCSRAAACCTSRADSTSPARRTGPFPSSLGLTEVGLQLRLTGGKTAATKPPPPPEKALDGRTVLASFDYKRTITPERYDRKLGRLQRDLSLLTRSRKMADRSLVMVCEGIRPDTILMIGQFDHWATPYAKDMHAPSMNALMPMLLDLTDATGSSADLVKVKVSRLGAAA